MNQISKRDMQILESMKRSAIEAVDTLRMKVEELSDYAQQYFDERTEKWQDSTKGEAYGEWVYQLDEKKCEIETMVDELTAIEFDDIQKP